MVFFLDEAHLLFKDASKASSTRSNGLRQTDPLQGRGRLLLHPAAHRHPQRRAVQLGARIQHALRAFTPDDQQALSKTVRTYPKTDVYDLASDLTSLGIGRPSSRCSPGGVLPHRSPGPGCVRRAR